MTWAKAVCQYTDNNHSVIVFYNAYSGIQLLGLESLNIWISALKSQALKSCEAQDDVCLNTQTCALRTLGVHIFRKYRETGPSLLKRAYFPPLHWQWCLLVQAEDPRLILQEWINSKHLAAHSSLKDRSYLSKSICQCWAGEALGFGFACLSKRRLVLTLHTVVNGLRDWLCSPVSFNYTSVQSCKHTHKQAFHTIVQSLKHKAFPKHLILN